jgi:hypothetical protein
MINLTSRRRRIADYIRRDPCDVKAYPRRESADDEPSAINETGRLVEVGLRGAPLYSLVAGGEAALGRTGWCVFLPWDTTEIPANSDVTVTTRAGIERRFVAVACKHYDTHWEIVLDEKY